MSARVEISDETYAAIAERLKAREDAAAIAAAVGVSKSRVIRIAKQLRRSGELDRRPRVLSPEIAARNAEIVRRRAAGESAVALSAEYDLGVDAIREIVATARKAAEQDAPPPVREMSPAKFAGTGYLQEINRRMCHRIGLALDLVDGRLVVYDHRRDPVGPVYGEALHTRDARDAAEHVSHLIDSRMSARARAVRSAGGIEPVPPHGPYHQPQPHGGVDGLGERDARGDYCPPIHRAPRAGR